MPQRAGLCITRRASRGDVFSLSLSRRPGARARRRALDALSRLAPRPFFLRKSAALARASLGPLLVDNCGLFVVRPFQQRRGPATCDRGGKTSLLRPIIEPEPGADVRRLGGLA